MKTFVKYGCPCFHLRYLIAVSSTTINSTGAIALPSRKPTLTLYSEDTCLPILTLQFNSLKFCRNSLILGGNLVYAFHSISPFSILSYAAWKSINRLCMCKYTAHVSKNQV